MDTLILLGGFAVLCALGVPVAYALGLSALLGALWADIPLEAVMLRISDGTDDFVLLAIPFFVLAGGIMAEGGMAARLIMLARVFVGFVRGGLAVVNVFASTMFGCISGSSVADTSAIGSVMIPQMEKVGYPRVFATNVTITASVQALLVPPSHNAVLYSLATGGAISISALFMAGVFPGLLLGFSLIVLCLVIAYRELRKLELEALEALYPKTMTTTGDARRQGFTDLSLLSLVTVDQFYGIECEEFPAEIAKSTVLGLLAGST